MDVSSVMYWLAFCFGAVLGGCVVAMFAGIRITRLEAEIRGLWKLFEMTTGVVVEDHHTKQ